MLVFLLYCGIAWASYGTCLVVYRFTLHPLAKFPGPWLAVATKWLEFYLDVVKGEGGEFMHELEQMHEKYGPIVRINPDEIHVKDPGWLDTLYPGPGKVRDKYPPAAHVAGLPKGTFGTVDHHVHRHRRNAVKAFESKRTVQTALASIRDTVEELCTRMRHYVSTGETFAVYLPYLAWSTDSASLYLEGKSAGLLRNEEKAETWKKTLQTVVDLMAFEKQIPSLMPLFFYLPLRLLRLISPSLHNIVAVHRDMEQSAVRAHAAVRHGAGGEQLTSALDTKSATPNVYQAIIKSSLPPQEKVAHRIAQEVFTLVVAGSSSAARVMTRMTFHLASEPSILERLQQELRTLMIDRFVTPELEQLEALPYLTAVIKETLRIAPLVASRSPLISPNELLFYGDWVIPAKTPVSMTPSSILTDPAIFTEPYEFRPERWLGMAAEQAYLERYFVPFGRGQRMCLGMNFTWAELYICTARLFRQFEFDLCSDVVRERDVDITRDCFLGEPSRQSRGVRVKVREAAE